MEASMALAVKKLQDSLSTTPKGTLESLQTQVEAVQKEWCCLAKDLRNEPQCQQPPTSTARQLEQCLENGVMLDPSCLAQSSQSQLIQNKPDYHSVLRRQRSVLSTVELVMDTQCKMVRELQSRQEQAQLLVNETSSRLAADVGFQYLSSDLVRDLLAGPVSSINQHIIHRIILVPLF
ncbi:kinetochore-associated protein DSN1 homolog isoform X1 [Oncorhynchus kisutch]|uniref:kinetochore-associated protein DSN1 homolog isoform X1 n=1 Tax=Oncorhynchus kisutch TaxID=8019 RepID=UPI0012DBF044|nr:kinetochore-associated protein DSN1 homolog isoform X1 [Oncorhynchus kisutch]